MTDRGELLLQLGRDLEELCRDEFALDVAILNLAAATDERERHAAAMRLAHEFPGIRAIGHLLSLNAATRSSLVQAILGGVEDRLCALRTASRLTAPALFKAMHAILPYSFSRLYTGQLRVVPVHAMRDEVHWQELRRHLAPLLAQGQIEIADDAHSMPLDAKVDFHRFEIATADVILLLVSPDLFDELKDVVDFAWKRRCEGARLVPILLSDTDLAGTIVDGLALLPRSGVPVLGSRNPSRGWVAVARGLRELVLARSSHPETSVSDAIPVCVLYAEQDRRAFLRLAEHLRVYEQSGVLSVWHPGCILAGDDIQEESAAAIRRAQVYVLLLSSSFVGSRRWGSFATSALVRVERGDAALVQILLRAVDLTTTPHARFQTVPKQPIASAIEPDEVWMEVAQMIRLSAEARRAAEH